MEFDARNREHRARWRWLLPHLLRRRARFRPAPGADLVRLTGNHVAIANRLLDLGARTGEAWPSHQALAALTGYSISTVQLALDLLRAAGLVIWRARWRCGQGEGWAAARRRNSNAYAFRLPTSYDGDGRGERGSPQNLPSASALPPALAASLARLAAVIGASKEDVAASLGVVT